MYSTVARDITSRNPVTAIAPPSSSMPMSAVAKSMPHSTARMAHLAMNGYALAIVFLPGAPAAVRAASSCDDIETRLYASRFTLHKRFRHGMFTQRSVLLNAYSTAGHGLVRRRWDHGGMDVTVSGKTCSTPACGQAAVAWYQYYGNSEQYACVAHNPFRNLTVNPPPQGGDLCPTCHQPWRVGF